MALFLSIPLPGATGTMAVQIEGFEEVIALPKKFRAAATAEMAKALDKSLKLGYITIIPMIPEDEGKALLSIKTRVTGIGLSDLGGELYSDLAYMPTLEFGRAPGSRPPPEAPLQAWAERHGMQWRGAGYGIAKAIGARGIPGLHMFERTFDEIRPRVESYFETAIDNALAKA